MEAHGCIHKWLSHFMKGNTSNVKSFVVPTIWVDSPELTASYYKNYLGFIRIISCPIKGSILLKNDKNWLLVKPILNNFVSENQRLKLYSKNVKEDYSLVFDKVRIVIPYSAESIEKFTIKDCNGIEIEYCAN